LKISADKIGFFYHALPPEVEALTLEQFHEIVTDLWLTRHDEEIKAEENSRRKGRPPSTKEVSLKALKARDTEDYRAGLGMSSDRLCFFVSVLT
jgi:translation machinery-associated protein 16